MRRVEKILPSPELMVRFLLLAACLLSAIASDAQSNGGTQSHENSSQPAYQMQVDNPDGSLFMEEVQSKRPDAQGSATAPREGIKRPDALRELGVPINGAGHMVPILQQDGTTFMPFGTTTSVFSEVPYPYPYSYGAYPYYAVPGAFPYASYGYLPPYGAPYAIPSAGVNLRLGRLNISVGRTYGAPPYAFPGIAAGYPFGYQAPPLGYAPTMYSSTGMGGFRFNSTASSGGLISPFGYSSSYSGSGLLAPLLHH